MPILSRFSALLYRAFLTVLRRRQTRSTFADRVWLGLLYRARRLVIRLYDPIVRMNVGAHDLDMPLSHVLPYNLVRSPSYDRELPRIALMLRQGARQFVMIDVGANIGDTAAFVAELMPDARVLCIEGSDRYADLLRSNVHRLGLNAECVQAYCGDGGEGGFVSEEESGTGRLRAVSPNPSSVRTQTLDEIVSAHPEFSRPALLKIDTDGFDAKVLRGARRLLEESHPVVFFEFAESLLWEAGESPSTIFPMLAQLGYARARVYSHEGIAAGTFDLSDPALMSDVEGVSRDAGYCDVLVWTEPLRAVLEPGVV